MNNKKLSILIVNYEFPPLGGGGGVSNYELGIEWVKEADVHVLTSSFKGLKSFEVMDGITVHRVKVLGRKSRDAASFISMLTYVMNATVKGIFLMRRHRYSVINTHFAVPSGPVGYILGRLFKVKNVLSLHGGDIYDPSKKLSPHKHPIFRQVVRFILNRADQIVAQSNNTRENAIKYYHPNKDVAIIPLPFHPFSVPEVTRKELKIAEKDFILLAIGRLVKRKSIDITIEALSQIDNSAIKLYVVGDGPEKENLAGLAEKHGIKEQVIFTGYVTEEYKHQLLSTANLFVLVSMHEGYGIVYMEAMLCGLPIVCSNHGGQVDFLINNENGTLIDVEDVQACRNSIEKFYTDRKFYKQCSENNLKQVKSFSADRVAQSYLTIFKEDT